MWWNILLLLKRLKRIGLHIVFLDATIGRAHQHAAGAPWRSSSTSGSPAPLTTPGGLVRIERRVTS
ncbi:MAG TPA: hypothetical protein VIH59_27850 [Candidatus Tectomicrobia bacterium]